MHNLDTIAQRLADGILATGGQLRCAVSCCAVLFGYEGGSLCMPKAQDLQLAVRILAPFWHARHRL